MDKLSNTYIIPSDVWCEKNPFNKTELYSWYMVSDIVDDDSTVRVTRKGELSLIPENSGGNQMIGISYLCGNESETVKKHIAKMSKEPKFDNAFWEITLYDKDKMIVSARTVNSQSVIEINSFEQLRACLVSRRVQITQQIFRQTTAIFRRNTVCISRKIA